MGAWLEFLQVALALGAGWLGYVLFRVASVTPPGRAQAPAQGRRAAAGPLPVAKPQAVDSER